MIRNIVIDFGGVLIALNKQASIQAFRNLGMESVAELINDYRSEGIFNVLFIPFLWMFQRLFKKVLVYL